MNAKLHGDSSLNKLEIHAESGLAIEVGNSDCN